MNSIVKKILPAGLMLISSACAPYHPYYPANGGYAATYGNYYGPNGAYFPPQRHYRQYGDSGWSDSGHSRHHDYNRGYTREYRDDDDRWDRR